MPVAPGHQPSRPTRRRFLRGVAQLAALGGVSSLLGACSDPGVVVVTPPPAPAHTPAPAALAVAAAAPEPAPAAVAAVRQAVSNRPGKAMYQADAQHTGRSPHAGPRRPRLLRSFDLSKLQTPQPGDARPNVESSAAVAPDGTLYLGNFPGNLVALREPASGAAGELELWWRFHPAGGSSFHATPALATDGIVYLGFSTGGMTPQAKGTFYALKAPTSGSEPQVVWTVDLGPGRQTASPTLGPDGTVYVTSGAGKLFAVAPDGTVKWTAMTGPSLKAAPALGADGTVYLASMNGKLYAVSPPSGGGSEGSVRWAFDFGEHPGKTPFVTAAVPPPGANAIGSGASPTIGPDGTIYIGANNSNFYALAPDGTLKWLFEAEREVAGIWSSAALSADGRTLYFGANKGGIYALDAGDGSKRWQFPIYGSVYNSPTLDSQGVLYTGSTAGHVFALEAASGELLFDYDAEGPVWTAPAIRPDGTLFVATTKGRALLLGEA